MVHGRACAPSRQMLRVAANEVRSRVALPKGADLFLLSQTGISKRDVKECVVYWYLFSFACLRPVHSRGGDTDMPNFQANLFWNSEI
jgi:hypothetical protein